MFLNYKEKKRFFKGPGEQNSQGSDYIHVPSLRNTIPNLHNCVRSCIWTLPPAVCEHSPGLLEIQTSQLLGNQTEHCPFPFQIQGIENVFIS